MTTTEAGAQPPWISLSEVARQFGLSRRGAAVVIRAAGVRKYHLPGLDPKFSRQDVQRVIARAAGEEGTP